MRIDNFDVIPFLRINQVKYYLNNFFNYRENQFRFDQLELIQLNQVQEFIFNRISQSDLARANLISLENFREIINALQQLNFRNNNFNEKLLAQVRIDLLNQFRNFPQ